MLLVMPHRSNNPSSGASFTLTLLVLVASIVGLGAFMAWLIRQIAAQTSSTITQAHSTALADAARAQEQAAMTALLASGQAVPAGKLDVGDTIDPEQAWEEQLPWYRQGEGYDPTDDRIPDPQSMNNGDRTVLLDPTVDFLEMVKKQPTPEGFTMPTPDLTGEAIQ